MAFGPLLSVICGLHRGPLGAGDLDFSPGVCLGGWDVRRTLCAAGAEAEGGGPADREADAPTHTSEGSSQPRVADGGFQDTCHMLGGPRKEKFP